MYCWMGWGFNCNVMLCTVGWGGVLVVGWCYVLRDGVGWCYVLWDGVGLYLWDGDMYCVMRFYGEVVLFTEGFGEGVI